MQIMCMEPERKAAEHLNSQRGARSTIVLCGSVSEVLARITEEGGDPYKIGVIPKTEITQDFLFVLEESATLQIVCEWRLPLRVHLA
ncbi:MAG: hypothetical protein A3J10_02935 [Candidatus Sungbacteria bacterium RIFCSPLOWO2_02_FULL_54_10]|nr:MAG: hypothetical protein A2679_00685 [Candidatus Sungbacteria bacterium RIFCSPHIGHO2_01_FULL_54_26]OHA02555.1 MAG: hypothetical protein A3C92_02820 [Candidatus Sungbacteria bacterium RIFCSPHIGHO2_02_FULL_53_17]OHA13512.1 MAG: hypothetical protein A3J10_02935 [Candidatus Sungbacteria bacterium RIFCSPLOWO2_02_FULL_54_10]